MGIREDTRKLKKQRVLDVLIRNPTMTNHDLKELFNISADYIRICRNELGLLRPTDVVVGKKCYAAGKFPLMPY